MRIRFGRSLATLSLSVWLASSAVGQMLFLHTEIDHAGHSHAHPGASFLLHHADHADDHQHPTWISPGLPLSCGAKLQPPQFLAVLPASLASRSAPETVGRVPEARPRGRPFADQRRSILLI